MFFFANGACILPSLFAQQNQFNVGLVGGINHTWFSGTIQDYYSYRPESHAMAGMTFQYNLPKVISFLSGISYEVKGGSFDFMETDRQGVIQQGSQAIRYNYAVVPFLVRATFGKRFNFFVNAGVFSALLVYSHQQFIDPGYKSFDQNTTTFFKRYDAGATLGLGFGIPITKKIILSLEVRHNIGLVNLTLHPVPGDPTIRTNSANLLLGIAYKLAPRK